VAGATRINPTKLGDYARGRKNFLQADLLALADYFHMDPNDLWGWVEIGFPESDEVPM
jgi:hypothetical protein